jgi:hypothetical protein
MRSISALTVAAVLVGAGAVAAQTGAAGKWTGETQGRGGTQQIVLELKVNGGALTGTYQQGEQPAAEIKEGKVVDASTITFKRTVAGRGGGGEFTIEYTGKINGAELVLTPMFQGGGPGGGGGGGRGPMPITLKRAS